MCFALLNVFFVGKSPLLHCFINAKSNHNLSIYECFMTKNLHKHHNICHFLKKKHSNEAKPVKPHYEIRAIILTLQK